MKKVYRHFLAFSLELQALALPLGSRVVQIGYDKKKIKLWVLGEESATVEVRKFRLYSTGTEVPSSYIYLGTVGDSSQYSVNWHVFEVHEGGELE